MLYVMRLSSGYQECHFLAGAWAVQRTARSGGVRKLRRLMTVMALVVWMLAGLTPMVLSDCMGMGVMCTALCALTSYVVPTSGSATRPQAMAYVPGAAQWYWPSIGVKVPDPPPRFPLSFS